MRGRRRVSLADTPMSGSENCVILTGFVSLVIFCGVFFGSTPYEDVQHNLDYTSTLCHIDSSDISQNFCPDLSCSSCNEAPYGVPNCGSVKTQWSGLNPKFTNLSVTTCENGYHCCQQICQTCESCSSSCGRSGCRTSCFPYQCNCQCVQSVGNLYCYLTPSICFTANLMISYKDKNDEQMFTEYSQGFGVNQGAANVYVDTTYATNHTYSCYYDTKDESKILWSISYRIPSFVAAMVFAFVFFMSVVYMVDYFIMSSIGYVNSFIRGYECMGWMLMIGCVIFLPLSFAPNVQVSNRLIFLVLACQFIILSPVALFHTYLLWNERSFLWYIGFIVCWYVPLGILAPLHQVITNNSAVFLPTVILLSLFSSLFVMFICLKSDTIGNYIQTRRQKRTEVAQNIQHTFTTTTFATSQTQQYEFDLPPTTTTELTNTLPSAPPPPYEESSYNISKR